MDYVFNFERHLATLKERDDGRPPVQDLRGYIKSLRSPYLDSSVVTSQVLPARIKRRPSDTKAPEVPLRTYISRASSHSASDIRMYRPSINKQAQGSENETNLSISRRRDDEITFRPSTYKPSDEARVAFPGLIPRPSILAPLPSRPVDELPDRSDMSPPEAGPKLQRPLSMAARLAASSKRTFY